MQGITALQQMNRVRAEWLAEAGTVYASIVAQNGGAGRSGGKTGGTSRGRRPRNSGLIAAAVCVAVGLGLYLTILAIGGRLGHDKPIAAVSGDTATHEYMTPEADAPTEAVTPAQTQAPTEAVTPAQTNTPTEADTPADTEPVTVPDTDTEPATDPEAQTRPETPQEQAIWNALTTLRADMDTSGYVVQELYCAHQTPDGKEYGIVQTWAKDTTDGNRRFYSFEEYGTPGHYGQPNEVTLIDTRLWFAKESGTVQRKRQTTVTAAQADAICADIDAARLSVPLSEFRDLTWMYDHAAGTVFVSVEVGSISNALLTRLLTVGYGEDAQSVTVTNVRCVMDFQVYRENGNGLSEVVKAGGGLRTVVWIDITRNGETEQLVVSLFERGADATMINFPEKANTYSTETDRETIVSDMRKLFHPEPAYAEKTMYITATALKVRATPDFGGDGNVIGYLKLGEAVTVTGETNDYYVIRYQDYPAYVGKKYLSPTKP